jgi:hypothetical protein
MDTSRSSGRKRGRADAVDRITMSASQRTAAVDTTDSHRLIVGAHAGGTGSTVVDAV